MQHFYTFPVYRGIFGVASSITNASDPMWHLVGQIDATMLWSAIRNASF